MKLLSRLWADEAGFVVSSELVLIATVLVIGMTVGISEIRNQVVQELADVADAISEIDQSYSYTSISGHLSHTDGAVFIDRGDRCDMDGATQSGDSSCVNVAITPDGEAGAGSQNTPG